MPLLHQFGVSHINKTQVLDLCFIRQLAEQGLIASDQSGPGLPALLDLLRQIPALKGKTEDCLELQLQREGVATEEIVDEMKGGRGLHPGTVWELLARVCRQGVIHRSYKKIYALGTRVLYGDQQAVFYAYTPRYRQLNARRKVIGPSIILGLESVDGAWPNRARFIATKIISSKKSSWRLLH